MYLPGHLPVGDQQQQLANLLASSVPLAAFNLPPGYTIVPTTAGLP